MTEEDKYALKEFLIGAAGVVGGLIAFIVIILATINLTSGSKPTNEPSFKVVDTYDNRCDVVRYAPHQVSEYKYFLDCSKND